MLTDALGQIVTVNGAPLGSGGGQGMSGVGKRYTTTEGIKAYHYRTPFKYGNTPEPRALSWSGASDSEGYATGPGTLKVIWRNTDRNEYSGTMQKGRLHGEVVKLYYVEGHESTTTSRMRASFDNGRTNGNWAKTDDQKAVDEQKVTAKKDAADATYKREREYLMEFRRSATEGGYVGAVPMGIAGSVSVAGFGGGVETGRVIAILGDGSLRIRRDNYRIGDEVPEVFSTHRGRLFPPEWSSSMVRKHVRD